MNLINILLILLCGTCLTTQATAMLKCGKGQHAKRVRNGQNICVTCPPGTFISLETHSLRRCNPCTIPLNFLHERLLKQCTPSSDTQIGCHEGYIRVSYEYVEVLGKSYGKCVLDTERNLTCSKGQYLKDNLDGDKICLSCPRGTFNSEDNHINKACTKCKRPRRKRHERKVRRCTSTSDTVIGCQQGFFHGTNGSCEKCSICWQTKRYEIEPCQLFKDTICSKEPATVFICGKGQYVVTYENNSQVCARCPAGTYMSDIEHTYPDCADCTKADTSLPELEKCTPTSDTVIGCQAGYFRKPYFKDGEKSYGDCQKCSSCAHPNMYEIKTCGPSYDAVCGFNVTCPKGHFLSRFDVCTPCPSGTFNSNDNHTDKNCTNCSRIEVTPSRERILKDCTSSSDTVIGCVDGYYRNNGTHNGTNGSCGKCSICWQDRRYELEPCQPFKDTNCSKQTATEFICGKGQYVVTYENQSQVCATCQSGTYNSEIEHHYKDCAPCSRPELNTERILNNCTSSSDTEIGCVDGYYRINDKHQGIMRTYGSCEKCSICLQERRYEVEPCKPFRDTICSKETLTDFTCGKGQYVTYKNKQLVCAPCPYGTYNSEIEHTYTDCAYCKKADTSLNELEVEKCTPTSDTVIGCQAGYFRKPYFQDGGKSYGECQKCSSCAYPNRYEIKPCGPYNDTVCGITVTCPKGHFVKTFKSTRKLGVCKPCPPGTFISTDNHTFTDCARCTQPDQFNHELTLTTCTPTSDTVIGCTPGYFRKPLFYSDMESYAECQKCSSCEYKNLQEITPCGPKSDTVCGPMLKLLVTCPKGQFLQIKNGGSKQNSCMPCPPENFISTDNHTFTDCIRCTQPEESAHEVTLTDCTPTSDTVIGCATGYFRKTLPHSDRKIDADCRKCSTCEPESNVNTQCKNFFVCAWEWLLSFFN